MSFESFVAPNQIEAFYIHAGNILVPISFHLQDLSPVWLSQITSEWCFPFRSWTFIKKADTHRPTYTQPLLNTGRVSVDIYIHMHSIHGHKHCLPLPLMKLSLQNYRH